METDSAARGLVRIERDGGIAVVWLDRPPVNAIDVELLRQADEILRSIEADESVRATVVTGAGHCFSAGLDLKAIPRYPIAAQRETIVTLNRVVTRLYGLPLPTIAAVNGHAIAGGLVLVLACDYRIGSRAPCQLGLTEARAGIPFPAAPLAVVKAELAPAVVRRLTLVARNVDSERALQDGMLDELAGPAAVLERAMTLARELAEIPRDAYMRVKRQFRSDVLASLERVNAAGTDPLLDSWLSPETGAAAASVLSDRR
jgi:enoyl-CoA hydratase